MTIPRPSLRHQDLIITLFALYARPPQESMRISTLVQMMGDLGYDAPGVRSAMSRLKSKGIVVTSKLANQAAYRLDTSMTETIVDGDVRIFADAPPDSCGHWVLATFTVPESLRPLRHQIRSTLSRLGFGLVSQALWIAPAANLHEAEVALQRRGLDQFVEFFVGSYAADDHLAEKIGQWWNLDELNSRFDEFIATYDRFPAPWVSSSQQAPTDQDAFRTYIPMLTMWRELPYAVPPLPPEHLPKGWNGPRVRTIFYAAHKALAAPAQRHAADRLAE
ncbi:PaaX family transcriptional regulator C-terminal domain-containing protein [Brevibacterium linens]|uniref:PaaX family transcriptional regulator n=1 Tax=Brevibacterium linens TaxID=1703 RepID=UPI003BF50089